MRIGINLLIGGLVVEINFFLLSACLHLFQINYKSEKLTSERPSVVDESVAYNWPFPII